MSITNKPFGTWSVETRRRVVFDMGVIVFSWRAVKNNLANQEKVGSNRESFPHFLLERMMVIGRVGNAFLKDLDVKNRWFDRSGFGQTEGRGNTDGVLRKPRPEFDRK
jgi:hypothetical protein